jgi:hypothetical protein
VTQAAEAAQAAAIAANAAILAGSETHPHQGVTHGCLGESMLGEFALGASLLTDVAQSAFIDRSLTFRLYVDGALTHTEELFGIEPFRLPDYDSGRDHEVELTGNVPVHSYEMAGSMAELQRT